MSDLDRQRWNKRYLANPAQAPSPCALLQDNLFLLPPPGQALDLACGHGGNALLLARLGWQTQAWDISDAVLAQLDALARSEQLPLTVHCVDLDAAQLPTVRFDLVVISGFLNRSLCPTIAALLRPGGLLFYQTFTRCKPIPGHGPSSPEFLLAPGEFLQLFPTLTPVFFRDNAELGQLHHGLRNQAQLIARQPE